MPRLCSPTEPDIGRRLVWLKHFEEWGIVVYMCVCVYIYIYIIYVCVCMPQAEVRQPGRTSRIGRTIALK